MFRFRIVPPKQNSYRILGPVAVPTPQSLRQVEYVASIFGPPGRDGDVAGDPGDLTVFLYLAAI